MASQKIRDRQRRECDPIEEQLLAVLRPFIGQPYTRKVAMGIVHALSPLASNYQCRECGITHIEPGWEIDGEPLCWADHDLCSRCQDFLQEQLEKDAARYRHLRNRQTRAADIEAGGVFAGRVPENLILGGEDLDRAVDAAMGGDMPETPTLEARLAECLADCIDTPLLTGRDEVGGFSSPLEIRIGFFRPELSERAAELLEEAGR
ncbi:MAG: hypothetical protein WA975_21615 [Mesorhizobium sp.]